MAESLRRELGSAVAFNQPQGGMFFWARLTGADGKSTHAGEFAKRAIDKGVAFVPGAPFFAHDPDLSTFRLSFATVGLEKIEEGIGRLGQAL
jgi:DNA-binding transcriptional MocR family regulator